MGRDGANGRWDTWACIFSKAHWYLGMIGGIFQYALDEQSLGKNKKIKIKRV
jgi:hypothetical protein